MNFLLLACFSLPAVASGWTDAEIKAMPPYCEGRMKQDAGKYESWAKALGPDFLHTHHYCYGLGYINRYYLARSRQPTALRGYGARGRDITWAVLDSGIDADHPHFTQHGNVVKIYDCLAAGPVRERDPKKSPTVGHDVLGHGTHVAGIIAGASDAQRISGIAPETRLISYKVLNDSGSGSDAKIIKAMDHIHETNAKSGDLAIHGVNLSLGGPFNPVVFGCGDSPLCKQLRKLWRQGVVVVLAAGNEGYLEIQQGQDTIPLNMDLSIGDPANLEECLAVGSVYKTKPMFCLNDFVV